MILINNKWYKGRLIFDFDGVLCVFGAKDYSQAVPYEISINQINRLSAEGWYIVIFTARYMARCNGNIGEAKLRGQEEAETWLRKFGVNFNEVILGKPSGDIYVDDRACRVEGWKGETDWKDNFWPLIQKLEDKNANLRLSL